MNDSPYFPIYDQLHSAGSHQERAAALLRLSDGLVHEFGILIRGCCQDLGFAAGVQFMTVRLAANLVVRDEHGLLPDHIASELELWREAMSRFAAGGERFDLAAPEPSIESEAP